jgi:hypothetical protein
MKLLLENWRKYAESALLLEKKTGWTVSDLDQLIDMARQGENKAAAAKLAGLGGLKVIQALPIIGKVASGVEFLHQIYKQNQKAKNRDPDAVEDYPILDILSIDPHLIKTLEDDILKAIDEEYQKYLRGLKYDTLLSNVISINDFIKKKIARETQNHVVIQDLSK